MRTSAAFGAMVLVAVAGLARGQSDGRLDIHTPPSVDLIRNVDSGEVGAVGGGELEVVWGEVVRAEGAAWVRLWFGPTHLAGDPAADGAVAGCLVRETCDWCCSRWSRNGRVTATS